MNVKHGFILRAFTALSLLLISQMSWAWIYAGIAIGKTKADLETTDVSGATGVDKTDTGGKIVLGYEFNPYLGVEAAWFDFGKVNTAGVSGNVRTRAIAAEGVVSYPLLNGEFILSARGGIYKSRLEESNNLTFVRKPEDKSGFIYGADVEYVFAPGWGFKLAYDQLLSPSSNNDLELDNRLLSAGLVWRF